MKIIAIDNFDRDWIPDSLIATGMPELQGNICVEALNEKLCGRNSPLFYKLVPDDYVLRKPEQP